MYRRLHPVNLAAGGKPMKRGRGDRWNHEYRQPGNDQPATRAQIEHALTALEDLIIAGQFDGIARWAALLWTNRDEAEDALLTRIRTGQVRLPGLALDVLGGIAGRRLPEIMRLVAADRSVPDILRLEAKRRLGWPAKSERKARNTFLESLQDAESALVDDLALYLGGPVLDGGILTDLLGYLLAMPAARRTEYVSMLVESFGPHASWLLRALLSAPDIATQRLCGEQLASLRDHGAAGALSRTEHLTRNPSVLQSVTAACRRLSFRALLPTTDPESDPVALRRTGLPGVAELPFEQVAMTAVDGDGGQVVLVVRRWDPDVFLVAEVFLRDDIGIVGAWGMTRTVGEQLDEALSIVTDRCPLVRVEPRDAIDTLQWAAECNLRTRRPLPPVFALWEPYFYPDLMPQAHHRGAEAKTLPLPPGPGRLGEGEVSRLFLSPFFSSWRFPVESVGTHVDLEKEPSPTIRWLLAARLQRQAWLLERDGDGELRDVALHVAATLDEGGSESLPGQAFLQALVVRGSARVILEPGRQGGRR